ncbi:unnamed protein product, partial [Amoebophrya sp. A120]
GLGAPRVGPRPCPGRMALWELRTGGGRLSRAPLLSMFERQRRATGRLRASFCLNQ